ncbi:MAG: aminotransferase class V-fold PLP-dependent enzyme [Bacillota bacterium]|nr:aminotransferase class V-fold PLP-dependent enzyme [Bacillota bacterium]
MKKIYADNSSTSFPKPNVVGSALLQYINNIGTNVARGNYEQSYSAGRIVFETRELLCEIFNFDEPLNVVFTSNITESLNIIIKGALKAGDHVITTSMEHNSVIRPLHTMTRLGVELTSVRCNKEGLLDIDLFSQGLMSSTRLVIVNHVSNVCGTIQQIEKIGHLCKSRGIDFIIDSAQSAGILPIDFFKLGLSALPFTGHKGLMGPQGVGGLILSSSFASKLQAFKEGGTGSFSEQEYQPEVLPDKFESGTLNIPGIFGLNAALKYIREIGTETIAGHEKHLGNLFLNNVLNIDGIKLHGMKSSENRTSVFSLTFDKMETAEVAYLLDSRYGIMTRSGIHCSPLAHKTLGTFPEGTVRFSFGYFNTEEEIDYICRAINEISKL